MKIIDLFEYKNKYYKPVPRRPKVRPKKTLWYDNYNNWVNDIKFRYPEAQAYYDEENEEIIAGCENCEETYGKWSKRSDRFPGVSFHKPRNMEHITRNKHRLKKLEDK